MKRKLLIISLMLVAMVLSCIPAAAVQGSIALHVQASAKEAAVGETVYYNILAAGEDVIALQLTVVVPAGMRYVSGSGKTPDGLKEQLDVAAADWTEDTMMFTFYNEKGIRIPEGTVLATFACEAEKSGTYEIALTEVVAGNSLFEEMTPSITSDPVAVSQDSTVEQTTATEPAQDPNEDAPDYQVTEPSGEEPVPETTAEGDEPVAEDLTLPNVESEPAGEQQETVESITASDSAAQQPTGENGAPDDQEEGGIAPPVATGGSQETAPFDDPQEEIPDDTASGSADHGTENNGQSSGNPVLWIVLSAVVVLAISAGSVWVIRKKKKKSE